LEEIRGRRNAGKGEAKVLGGIDRLIRFLTHEKDREKKKEVEVPMSREKKLPLKLREEETLLRGRDLRHIKEGEFVGREVQKDRRGAQDQRGGSGGNKIAGESETGNVRSVKPGRAGRNEMPSGMKQLSIRNNVSRAKKKNRGAATERV